jgi:hypothetical protein
MTQFEGVTRNGTTITITPPGGGWTAIVHRCEVRARTTARLTTARPEVIAGALQTQR